MPFARPIAAQVIIVLLLLGMDLTSSVSALADEAPVIDQDLKHLIQNDTDQRLDMRPPQPRLRNVSQLSDGEQPAEDKLQASRDQPKSRWHIGLGQFDVLDQNRRPSINLEYRDRRTAFFLSPAIGLIANTDGGVYGYGAIYSSIALGRIRLVPELSIGGYLQGSSKDLGGVFAFREALELSYQTESGIAIGLQFAHISNADIYENNPGQEDLHLTISGPLDIFF